MASSSSSGGDRKYDVFLSFRGEDTRKTFVGHLYDALIQKTMNAYQDSKDLEKGNKILELLQVIEDSRISIVVLSQNYASSKWCLRELAKIMDCRDNKKQIVVPIFYEVDPSDVRNIKGIFSQAFANHEANSQLAKEELESWRSALNRVADLSGWDSRDYRDDRELIKDVVGDTLSKWIHTSSNKVNKGLVGMDSHITEMNAKLCLEVNDVRVVGIWGMGGLGKTTIAEAVYGEIACEFEYSCFVHDVKDKRETEVQKELILSLLKEKGQGIDLQRGREMIMKRLSTRKVLVVLDDVENFSQIKELLGEPHAFGNGSRIIVTTRDQQSPKEVNEAYHPECLNQMNSHELLVKHAFGTDPPNEEYIDLLNQATEYAHGLPLALKVLGASLYDKNIHEWKDVLQKIKINPDRKILDVLKISFEGLDFPERQIFLDIACLFRGWPQDFVTEILHGLHPHIGLKNLVNRALVMISEYGELHMHDLLQELGREIVRREFLGRPLKEPGQRSRLWSFKDVDQVLTQNTATDAIECLMLDMTGKDDTYCINIGAFIRMTKLRVLIIYDDGLDPSVKRFTRGESEFLSHELRLLNWLGCPLESLPNTFIPKNLVMLDMSYSHIQQLWEGTMPLQNLKEIRLRHCRSLVKIPDLTEAIHLKKLELDDCSSLRELHSSIYALLELKYLTLEDCEQLKILPSSIHMKSVETLNFSGCSNLVKFPEISDVMLELQELDLVGTAIKELPESINNLTRLRVLDLSYCAELATLPSSIHLSSLQTFDLKGCSNLEKLPDIFGTMKKLPELCLDGTAVKGLPSSIHMLEGLKKLTMRNCESLECLPDSICNLAQLTCLDLSGCIQLKTLSFLPDTIWSLPKLVLLDLSDCTQLRTLSGSIHMSSLKNLNLRGCSNLEKFPEISGTMKKLSELCLDSTAVKGLPSSIHLLEGLKKLTMRNCKSLECLPDSICNLAQLTCLDLSGCIQLKTLSFLPDTIWSLPKLVLLDLSDCTQLRTLSGSIHMSSLKNLNLRGCSNLEKFPEISGTMKKLSKLCLDSTAVKGLPSSIHMLEGLKKLTMRNCESLECLPDSICNLAQLTRLDLSGCIQPKTLSFLPDTIWSLPKLVLLDLSDCTQLRTLLGSIHMSSLKNLNLRGCSNLEKFPEISGTMKKLSELCLDSTAVKGLPSSIHLLEGLKKLTMRNCKSLECLPDSICNLAQLTCLDLSGCIQLKTLSFLPDTIWSLPKLVLLDLSDCTQLRTLSGSIHKSSLKNLNLRGCSNLEKFPEISGTMKKLSELCLDSTAVKGLPSSIHLLGGLKKLTMRNCKSLECLPDSIGNLAQLTHLDLEGCNRLKSIPELSSINRLNAHCCTALETVGAPKIDCTDLDFRFSNCRLLVQTNLFTNIVETHFLDQVPLSLSLPLYRRPLSCYMCFPGSEIPNWFSHQSSASSISVQLPPTWFDKMFLGFAICAVSCFNRAGSRYYNPVARCYCTFKGNQGEHNFSFHLQDWDFTSRRPLESDHMFMAYVSWSKFSLAEKGERVNERYYTEATFKIVVENESTYNPSPRLEHHCMTGYGVRFFHGSFMDGQNERMINTTNPVERLGVPFFPDQLEIRKSATEWEAESTETAAERGSCQRLDLLPEPQTGRKEEEVMVAATQVDGPRVLGSVCCCLSLSGCSCIKSLSTEREREGEKGSELGSHSSLVVPNSGWGAKKRKI